MEYIESKDLTGVLVNVIIVKLVLYYPRKIVSLCGNSAWISAIYLTALMLLIYYLINKIYNISVPVLKQADALGGKALRFIIGVVLISVLALSMCIVARLYPETVKIILLKQTPIEIIVIIFTVAAVLACYCGIYAISRVINIFLPVAGLIMLICFVLLIKNMDIKNIMPILGPGVKTLFFDSIMLLSGFSDLVVIFLLNLSSKNKNTTAQSGYKAIIITGVAITLILFSYNMIFPYYLSKDFLMPVYQLTRVAEVGEFFSRLEAFYEFIWTILVMLYFSVYLYTISYIWKTIFNIKYQKPLLASIIIIVSYISLRPNIYTRFDDIFSYYTVSVLLVMITVPLLIGIVDKIKNRSSHNENS